MGKTIEAAGKTLDDAINAALRELQVDRDAVTVEVLEKGKSGFLGIGGTPARIRVTLLAEEESAKAAPPPKKESSIPARAGTPPAEAPQKKWESSPEQPSPRPRPRRQENSAPATPEQTQKATELLAGILQRMGLSDARVSARQEERFLLLDVTGSGLGRLIGRRGDTLDAVQRLCAGIINRGQEKHVRIVVDTEQYRQKREEALIRLAHKTAEKAVRYRTNMVLEPMNSYARHVIHTALQDNPGVTTHSVGSEPHRHVVITVPGGNENRTRPGNRYHN